MSLLSFISGLDFKPLIPDSKFTFIERFDAHGVKTITVLAVGDSLAPHRLTRKGRSWVDAPAGGEKADEPTIVLLTTRTLTCEHRELPPLPGGNSEAALAQALAEKPAQVLRDAHEHERAYHLVPMDSTRWALVFSVQNTDVQRAETEVSRRGLLCAGVVCGMARATKFAISRIEHDTQTIVVCDQQSAVVLSARAGRIEHTSTLLSYRAGDAASEREFRDALVERAHSDCPEGKQPTVDFFTTDHAAAKPAVLDGSGITCRHHSISLLDLCFA